MTVSARARTNVSHLDSYAIEAYNLRKTYRTRKGRQTALAGLDLKVRSAGVHGFLPEVFLSAAFRKFRAV